MSLMQIKILSHVNPNVSSKILALFLFIHSSKLFNDYFKDYSKDFFPKFSKNRKMRRNPGTFSSIYLLDHTRYFPRFRELERAMVHLHRDFTQYLVCKSGG